MTKQKHIVSEPRQGSEATVQAVPPLVVDVTPEMVAAGVARLQELLEARVGLSYLVAEVFSVMLQLSSHDQILLSGQPFKISRDAQMWNDGVLGLHSSDAYLMKEALNLGDQMWPKLQDAPPPVHNVNQFLSGYFLERTLISESHDMFTTTGPHICVSRSAGGCPSYWPPEWAPRWRGVRERVSPSGRGPIPSGRSRLGVRAGLRRLGLRVPGVRTNDGVRPPRRRGGKGSDVIGGSLSS
ncbi:MAG: hypothetical protein ACREDT_08770 [Methylocella sp.]